MKARNKGKSLSLISASIILIFSLVLLLIPFGFIYAEPGSGSCWIIGYGPNYGESTTLYVAAMNAAGKYFFADITDSSGNPIATTPKFYLIGSDFFIGAGDFSMTGLTSRDYNAVLKLYNDIDADNNPVGDPVFTSSPFSFSMWDHIQNLNVSSAKKTNNINYSFYVTNSDGLTWQLELYKSNYNSGGGQPPYWKDYRGTIGSDNWLVEDKLPSGEYMTILDINMPDPDNLNDYESYQNMIRFVVTPSDEVYEFGENDGYYPSDSIKGDFMPDKGLKNYIESDLKDTLPPELFTELIAILDSAISACYIGDLKEAEKYLKDFIKVVKKSSISQELKDDLISRAQTAKDYLLSGVKK